MERRVANLLSSSDNRLVDSHRQKIQRDARIPDTEDTMRNILYGALSSALLFAAFAWWTAKPAVHAAILSVPPAGRFQIVQLHPNTNTEWSGILDTQTGCTWVLTKNDAEDPTIKLAAYKEYLQVLGDHSFDLVNFDATDYVSADLKQQGGSATQVPGTTVDYTKPIRELSRIQQMCSQSRVEALVTTTTH